MKSPDPTPQQRALLSRYFASGRDLLDLSLEMAKRDEAAFLTSLWNTRLAGPKATAPMCPPAQETSFPGDLSPQCRLDRPRVMLCPRLASMLCRAPTATTSLPSPGHRDPEGPPSQAFCSFHLAPRPPPSPASPATSPLPRGHAGALGGWLCVASHPPPASKHQLPRVPCSRAGGGPPSLPRVGGVTLALSRQTRAGRGVVLPPCCG